MPAKEKKPVNAKAKTITFKCPVCQKVKPLDEMVVVTRFFPALNICRSCEKTL